MPRTPWALPRAGSPNGTPMTAACWRGSASPRASASPALSTSAGRQSRPRIATVPSSTRSSRATPARDPGRWKPVSGQDHAPSEQCLSMFYEPDRRDATLLPHDPFKAIVAPRPIGWVTSIDRNGNVNLAPYSYFNGVNSRPNLVMFASEGQKDSVSFIADTKEFVCNLASFDLREQMNATSAPLARGVDEMVRAGLAPAPSRLVKPPRVAAAPCALECRLLQIVTLDDVAGRPLDCHVVFGQVVGVHIDDRFVRDGRLDTAALRPIARCGYDEYAVVESVFSMRRPTA